MIDNIELGSFLVTMVIILVVCLTVAVLGQIRLYRIDRDYDTAVERAVDTMGKHGCGHLWGEHHKHHVCTRPYQHDGPHLDSEHEALLR